MSDKVKVFGADLSITGTTSLQPAFSLLGCRDCDGWTKRCGFIGVSEPMAPFPYANKAHDRDTA